jgi:hypothetical protein
MGAGGNGGVGWGEVNEVVALVWVAVQDCELERGLGAKGSKPSM